MAESGRAAVVQSRTPEMNRRASPAETGGRCRYDIRRKTDQFDLFFSPWHDSAALEISLWTGKSHNET
jgi:quinol monooxygenase YgiN